MIPQVSLTRTQFKETSIWDVSSQLMKLQTINIQENTTTINEVLILGKISTCGIPTKRFCFDRCLHEEIKNEFQYCMAIDLSNDVTVKRKFEDGSFCLFILFTIMDLPVSILCVVVPAATYDTIEFPK